MRKNFWRFVKDESGERVLRLEGIISDTTWADDEINPRVFRDELNSGTGDIVVWINSAGGDFWAGVQIYNMLREYRGKVTIRIDAIAASAASVIAMAGDTVEISGSGMMMIHNPSSFVEGDEAQMKSAAEMLSQVKESIITAYEMKTHLPREELSEMMDAETWLNAQKAVELGFADKIIGKENPFSTIADMLTRRQIKNCVSKAIGLRPRVDAAKYYKRLIDKRLIGRVDNS